MLQFYRQQLYAQSAPEKLFEKMPVLDFRAERQLCPVDGQCLQVRKTYKRTIKALGIGTFKARHIVLWCKEHRELGCWHSQELAELVPAHGNAAYDLIVEVGKLRFHENRQVREIQEILRQQHSVNVSASEIEQLADRFVFYLAAVHQESTELLRKMIQAQGGMILHVDTTCAGDSPKLAVSLDSVSGLVLYSVKLNTENQDELATFLEQIKTRFGTPLALVSDLSKAIAAAVTEVFGVIGHYVCHFHFLSVIGFLLLEKEQDALRHALSQAGISGKLKTWARKMAKSFETVAITEIETHLNSPRSLGQTPEATELFTYYLMLWVLDHAACGNGYGFPFDHRYLNFYERLQAAATLLEEVKSYYPVQSENDKILWKLDRLLEKIVSDSKLRRTVQQYKAKLAIFSDLRRALGVAPESTGNGLRQMTVTTSHQELQQIRTALQAFLQRLDRQIQTTDQSLQENLLKVKERINEYEPKLLADPIVVEVNGEKRHIFIHRTNNILEHYFRRLNYSRRRIHGNRSVRRDLENMPEQLPVVENYLNPNYVKLIFADDSKIAERFADIDVKIIRQMAADHRRKKRSLCSRKTKRILRRPKFQQLLRAAFAAVAG